MDTLAVDIETFSRIDIRSAGVYAYVNSPDFEVLLIAYKLNDEEVQIVDLTNGDRTDRIFELLTDPGTIKTAYNANFERTCLAKAFATPMPPEEWRCTAVLASTLGLPGNLAEVGRALDLEEDAQKAKTGKALINYFCKPCKPTKTNGGRTRNYPEHDPDRWQMFKDYCVQDVVAETAIREKLRPYKTTDKEQQLWSFDQRMNDRGVRLDMDFVNGIIDFDTQNTACLIDEARKITGLDNPNSITQLRQWLNGQGVPVASLTKDTVAEQLKTDLPMKLRRVLEIRQALGKTSTKKYQAMTEAVCPDNRLRGILQFYGANRTGRFAGKIVQIHNLPRNKIPDLDQARSLVELKLFGDLEMLYGPAPFVFSELIRTAFIPSPGCRFVVSDFSAIEARVIAWLADEQWRLDVFNSHGKIYEASASQMFGVPVEEITKGHPLRQKGKIAELALGYAGGVGALITMGALDMGLKEEELQPLVDQWRSANPKIVKLWRNVENAAKIAIEEHRTIKLKHGIAFSCINGILFITLPSGRKLAYYKVRLEEGQYSPQIEYAGVEQNTKRWGRLRTYSGKLTENIVQAIARDCLAEALLRVEAAGYDIVMHVHDELIADVPLEDTKAPAKITEIMSQDIDWAPGLPLKGDTFETPFYKKD